MFKAELLPEPEYPISENPTFAAFSESPINFVLAINSALFT